MALFIDPPRWPAHGTVFSHLVSDHSLKELYEFAAHVGLHPRSFDEDHFDVPAELYDHVVQAGACEVSGTQLIRLLRTSGLRVPARHRAPALVSHLDRRWRALDPHRVSVGEDLLRMWSEPQRGYHSLVHLFDCLNMVERLGSLEGVGASDLVRYAVWFHDAVYEGIPGQDEEASADLARKWLEGALGEQVARLVLLTKNHQTDPSDIDGAVLIDADLSILSTDHNQYWRYVLNVRKEYASVPEQQWRHGRGQVLETLLAKPALFATRTARRDWETQARSNLEAELSFLRT